MKKTTGFWIMKSLLFCMCLFFVISSGCTGERGHTGVNGKNGINGINNLTMNLTPNMTANSSSFYNNSYALLQGQPGGQVLTGGTGENDDLILNGTSSATKTSSYVILQPNEGFTGVGILNPQAILHTYRPTSDNILWVQAAAGATVLDLDGVKSNAETQFGLVRFINTGDTIAAIVGRVGTNNQSGSLNFYTQNTNAVNYVLRARIDQYGNFTLGGTTTSTAQFDTSGSVRHRILGAGTIMSDSVGNIYVISDPKLKTDIKPYVSGLKEILSIPSSAMIKYKFLPESGLDTKNEYSGFDASILSSAIPEAVFSKLDTQWIQQKTGKLVDGEDEYTSIEVPKLNEKGEQTFTLSISDRPIIAAQITAIQELNAKIEAQQAQIDNLMERIAKLEKGVKL